MNNSVMVLGGSGFLGQTIINTLIQCGFINIACGDILPLNLKDVKDVYVDILNYDLLYNACKPYAIVINCTGQKSSPINLCFKLNSIGTKNIYTICKNLEKRLIHVSTVTVYGTADFVDQNTPVNPETPYATCKAYAEFILSDADQIDLTILRLSNLFGYKQPKGIIGYLQKAFHADKKLYFNNNGDMLRYYLHVQDCADNIIKVITRPIRGVYNLIGNEKYTIKELINLFESIKKMKFSVKFEERHPLENINIIADGKIKNLIPIKYSHSIVEFLKS